LKRLVPIEGLRAYLAFWVLVDHVLCFSGYDGAATSNKALLLLYSGRLAVDIFMIVSGFVIFALLDRRQENYAQFICRRFFRLYPVFLLLFLASIPLSLVEMWDVQHGGQVQTAGDAQYIADSLNQAWTHWRGDVLLHLTMLHGVLPDSLWGRHTSEAFIGPGWSISLEWQFYLVAPLIYWLATQCAERGRVILSLAAILLLVIGHYVSWGWGFLPVHTGFFIVGIVSYFLYKEREQWHKSVAGTFPILVCVALFLCTMPEASKTIIPLACWMGFSGLLIEPADSLSSRVFTPWFTNPVAQFLGKISFDIYLAHEPILTLSQAALLTWLPHLGRAAHFWALFALTATVTVAVSTLLHYTIELPGMRLGRALAMKLKARRELAPA
jgi:peptidoglycan/LPS O-acetylase OafA/YrhL